MEDYLPMWWTTLMRQYQQGVGRVFVLHDNVNDVVYHPTESEEHLFLSRPRPFRDMLIYLLACHNKFESHENNERVPFASIFYVSPTIPLMMYYLEYNEVLKAQTLQNVYVDQKKFKQEIEKLDTMSEDQRKTFILEFPQKIRSSSRSIPETDMRTLLFEMEPLLDRVDTNWFPVALVLDFFEKITTEQEQRANYVTEEIMRRWALSDKMKRSKNMVLGLTVDLNALPALLRKSDSQIQKIQIPMPSLDDRYRFLSYWKDPIAYEEALKIEVGSLDSSTSSDDKTISQEGKEDEHLKELAGLTKGFRLLNLETMVRMAKVEGHEGQIDNELFKRQKATVIKEESFELLDEIPAKRTFDAIGGLAYAKDYFQQIANKILLSQTEALHARSVPKGILLVGPPGTGKTILAEALAAQGKMTLVKLGDIRSSYVGQSEQNMSRALKLLEELAPVTVFVDEIDQSIGRRTTGHEGDSGTNRRLFGKLLEFMGDNQYRGRVLWIGASNRPDMLDEAMISRFDTVMAILPPYPLEERRHIIEVMEHNVQIDYAQDVRDNLYDIANTLEGSSGRAIETIVRKAADIAENNEVDKKILDQAIKLYKPNMDIKEIDSQTIHALISTNFTDMMPNDVNHYPDRLQPFVREAIDNKSNLPLKQCLREIEAGNIYK